MVVTKFFSAEILKIEKTTWLVRLFVQIYCSCGIGTCQNFIFQWNLIYIFYSTINDNNYCIIREFLNSKNCQALKLLHCDNEKFLKKNSIYTILEANFHYLNGLATIFLFKLSWLYLQFHLPFFFLSILPILHYTLLLYYFLSFFTCQQFKKNSLI